MTEFSRGFWEWASPHWFLAFVLLFCGFWGSTMILLAFFRIFKRPSAKLTINLPREGRPAREGQPNRIQRELSVGTTEDLKQLLRNAIADNNRPQQTPQRRSVWDRIRANADDEGD